MSYNILTQLLFAISTSSVYDNGNGNTHYYFLIGLIIAYFATQNTGPVTLHFFTYSFPGFLPILL